MEYTLYKPNKKQTGTAIKFNVHKSGKFSFMKAAEQIAEMGSPKVFGWDDPKAINVKMGLNDLGAFLSVFVGSQETVKLFHRTETDNKSIELTHAPARGGYGLKVSHQIQSTREVDNLFIGVTYAEAAIIKVYVESAIRDILEANVWSGE